MHHYVSAANHLKKFTINLSYTPLLDWKILLDYFRMHQIIGVEKITEDSYERNFEMNNVFGFFKISSQKIDIILEVSLPNESLLPLVKQKVRKMFDLDLNPEILHARFLRNSLLKDTYKKYPALRIPGGWDIFETAINTIISQSISISAARKILSKLVAKCGKQIIHPVSKEKMFLFPTPEKLFDADLTTIGMTNAKINAIKELCEKIIKKEINLDNEDFIIVEADLLKIKGIGKWTVEYIKLRCSSSKNGFPASDLILKNYIKDFSNTNEFEDIKSYLAIYLWQHHLTK